MDDVTIRDADLRDAGVIATIQVLASHAAYASIFPLGPSSITVANRIPVWQRIITDAAKHERILVAEEHAEVSGYTHFGASHDPDGSEATGELYSLYVIPERWRDGIGRTLLGASTLALRDAGFDAATLWVLAGNDRARLFYERFGWHRDGAEKLVDAEVKEVRYRFVLSQR